MGIAKDCLDFSAAWRAVARRCDNCKSAPALLYCRVDSAFMCMACDSKLHDTNKLTSCHEKVWMCEVCEQAPATVNCKADAAALCVTCDRDIHSANPLAQRHERTPVVPFYDTAEAMLKSISQSNSMSAMANFHVQDTKITSCHGHTDYNTDDSWISLNQINSKYTDEAPDLKSMEYLLSGSDPFMEFDYPVSIENQYNSGNDSVVPVQTMKPPPTPARLVDHSKSETRFEIDFTRSSINSYNNNSFKTTPSLSQSVSSSSLDVGVVPDGSSMSETSYNFGQSVDLGGPTSGNTPCASQLVGKDRQARVLRYREKRKNRKFEKTIRYASRKAYAETRPRVKGRFAKRSSSSTEIECEIDQLFGSESSGFSFSEATRFGIVPSF